MTAEVHAVRTKTPSSPRFAGMNLGSFRFPSSSNNRRGCSGRFGSLLFRYRDFLRRFCEVFAAVPYEYQSPRKVFGLPLLHINLGFDNPSGKMRRARGVIAIGNQATGVLAFGLFFASGIFTIAPVAVGGLAVSVGGLALASVSVVGIGLVSVSIFAVGWLAVGIIPLGVKSVGILAIGQNVVGILGIGQEVHAIFSP